MHRLGLKFGIYETPGISEQAVTRDTHVLGTRYTADQITDHRAENNYNCGGMVGLDFRSPGAQAYVDSIVRQLASWGVDDVKLDGISDRDTAMIHAWHVAIARSGRPIVLNITQGSYTIAIAPALRRWADQWEFTPDIETSGPHEGLAAGCNAAPYTGCRSVFPLTSFRHWRDRFAAVARWQPVGGPQGFNDYDSIEVGNGVADSGMTVAAQRSQLSLWALGSAPLILGDDLSGAIANDYGSRAGLTATGLRLLTDRRVIAVDRDGIDARRVARSPDAQVFAKREPGGDVVVGLFDTQPDPSSAPATVSISARALGLGRDRGGATVTDLWSGGRTRLAPGAALARPVAAEGVALLRVSPRAGR